MYFVYLVVQNQATRSATIPRFMKIKTLLTGLSCLLWLQAAAVHAQEAETADAKPAEIVAPVETIVVEAAPEPERPTLEADGLHLEIEPWGAGIHSLQVILEGADGQPEIYELAGNQKIAAGSRNPFSARCLGIDGTWLLDASKPADPENLAFTLGGQWQVVSQDARQVTLRIEVPASAPQIAVERTWRLESDLPSGIALTQRIHSVDGKPHKVALQTWLLGDIAGDKTAYMGDKRKLTFGHTWVGKEGVRADGAFVDRMKAVNKLKARMENPEKGWSRLWPLPNLDATGEKTDLAFLAASNRYFLLSASPWAAGNQVIPFEQDWDSLATSLLDTPKSLGESGSHMDKAMFHLATSKSLEVKPDAPVALDLEIAAGLRSKDNLSHPRWQALGLDQTIRYRLTEGFCGVCTFQWLANLLLQMLEWFHMVLGDWGAAIIVLVLIVRLLLHPLLKRSQMSMMKMGKLQQKLAPKIEKIKKRHADDSAEQQRQIMALYQEHGFNPLAMAGGCLPLFLQMPIWVALYAMLYYTTELRHQPAFWGVFQNFGWEFLSDLSYSDRFIAFMPSSADTVWQAPFIPIQFDYSALNILPILMGVVMFINMKFTTPPPPPGETDEQAQMRKMNQTMMKIIPFMMPIFLYAAPAGLTLYICASTFAGILDAKMVRRKIQKMEADGTLFTKKEAKPGSWRAKLQQRVEMAKKMQEMQQQSGLSQEEFRKKMAAEAAKRKKPKKS